MENYISEVIGTMILILLGDGVVANVVLNKTKGNNSGWIVITTGWGLAVFTAVYITGSISGAHINPAVTFGLAIEGSFDWGQLPGYWVAQVIGAFIGAILVWLAYFKHWEGTPPGGQLAVFSTGPIGASGSSAGPHATASSSPTITRFSLLMVAPPSEAAV